MQDVATPDLDRSIVREGVAMASTISTDLAQAGHTVHLPIDFRIPVESLAEVGVLPQSIRDFERLPDLLRGLARRCGAIIVIAPECAGRLVMALDWIAEFSDRIISPSGEIVRIGCSKQKTVRWLESHGVQKPFEIQAAHPVVLKPDDGAGSDRIQVLKGPNAIPHFVGDQLSTWRVERFLTGSAVSLSVIGGPRGNFFFPPTFQIFDGASPRDLIQNFDSEANWPGPWIGFDYPIGESLADRAVALCERALISLPTFTGVLGMDLILSETGASEDRIVDLNPRMTTSWVGLRSLFSSNLAAFMVNHSRGINCQFPVPKTTELGFRLATE